MCDRGMKLLRGLVITGVLLGIVTSAVADHPLLRRFVVIKQTCWPVYCAKEHLSVCACRTGQARWLMLRCEAARRAFACC